MRHLRLQPLPHRLYREHLPRLPVSKLCLTDRFSQRHRLHPLHHPRLRRLIHLQPLRHQPLRLPAVAEGAGVELVPEVSVSMMGQP